MIEIGQLTEDDIGRRVLYEAVAGSGIETPAQLVAYDKDSLVLGVPTKEHKGLHTIFDTSSRPRQERQMPREVKCTSCDTKGEHWHWEGEPFLSRSYRGPCNSCGGKRFWMHFDMFDVLPLVRRLPLSHLIRLDAELHFDLSEGPSSLTLRFLRYAMKDAVRWVLIQDYKLSESALWGWRHYPDESGCDPCPHSSPNN